MDARFFSIFDGRFTGTDDDDWFYGSEDAEEFNGLGGTDTVDYSNSKAGVTVDLHSGLGYDGDAERDTYDDIENVVGSQHRDLLQGDKFSNTLKGLDGDDFISGGGGDDILLGGGGADWLSGGAGADVIDGGAGQDIADYSSSTSRVGIDLASGTANGGHASGDTLISIENVAGSWMDGNELFGDGQANRLVSNGSNDIVHGRGGNDALVIRWFDSQVLGGAGNDTISIARGGHAVDGGSGNDTLTLLNRLSRDWEVDLTQDVARHDGFSDSSLNSIENVVGSSRDDVIRGDGADNTLYGFLGNDRIEGRGGDDFLWGGRGADVFVFDHNDFGEQDVIDRFEPGIDGIDLSDTEITSWNDLNDSGDGDYWQQAGADVVIHSSDTDTITLLNTRLSDLNWFDFTF